MDYANCLICEGRYWNVFVHSQQAYLGRCYFYLRREGVTDLLEASMRELAYLRRGMTRMRAALAECFAPDLINYAALGNVHRHLHVHLIPRYATARTFAGRTFLDLRWGANYSPYPAEVLPAQTLESIRLALRSQLLPPQARSVHFC